MLQSSTQQQKGKRKSTDLENEQVEKNESGTLVCSHLTCQGTNSGNLGKIMPQSVSLITGFLLLHTVPIIVFTPVISHFIY